MKWLVRIALGLAALAVLVLVAAWLLLPRLLDDGAVRERITRAARESLGRDLRYERLELGFLPPSLRALGTEISGETGEQAPLLEAREISLRVSLWPLLFGAVVVDSLVIDGATVRLTRTDQGIALPQPPDDVSPAAGEGTGGAGASGSGTEEAAEEGGVALAVREVSLRDSTVFLDDRAVSPAVAWEVREIDARARGSSLDEPIDLDLSASLASGGSIEVKGTASTAGALDLSLRLDDLAVAPLAPYLGAEIQELAGRIGGTATVSGPAAAPERLVADLVGRDMRLRREDLTVAGPVALKVDLAHPLGGGAADGSFDLDATDAQLGMGGGFTKPTGTPARVTGRIVPAAGGGLGIDDLKLVIKNFEASGRVSSLDPVNAELRAEPFELAGWGEILPALAESQPEGRLALPGLRYTASPQALVGSVRLDGVSLRSEGAPPLVVEGLLRAEGDRVRSEGLRARTADQSFDLDARVERLFATPRYQLDVKASEADSNVLMGALLSKPDTLFGPLGLDASFRGEAGGDPMESLDGRIDFGIVDGRLVGVSLLRSVTERLGQAGNLALNLGKAFGGRDLQRFYGDEFELMEGVLALSGGVARTEEDLRFVYRGYTVSLRGKLDLRDLALDMTGQLTIQPELDEKLARELRLPGSYTPRSRVLPLTAVRGTLDAPKITLSPELPVSLAASYARESLGLGQSDAGTGRLEKAVGDLLQDALGGGRR